MEYPDNMDIPKSCPGTGNENSGKASGCSGCPGQSSCCKSTPTTTAKYTLAVMSGKGGVGKSTVAVQLAYGLAQQGYSVGLLDVDLSGPSVPVMTATRGADIIQTEDGKWPPIEAESNLCVMSVEFILPKQDDAIAWRGPRRHKLVESFVKNVTWPEDLDYMVVDTPPGTTDEHMSLLQLLKVDGVLCVSTPQEVSLADVRKQQTFCKKIKANILGLVVNMACISCPHCHKEIELFEQAKLPTMPVVSKIPFEISLNRAAERGEYFENDAMEKVVDFVIDAVAD